MEVIIVMMIIGVLSVMSISGYISYRRAALLNFAADSFVSQVKELREDTIHGDFGEEGVAKCFGFYFSFVENGYEPTFFSQDFIGKKKWQGEEFEYQGCAEFNAVNSDTFSESDVFQLDSSVSVVDLIRGDGDVRPDDFVMRFSPPKGEIDFSVNGGSTFEKSKEDGDEITVTLKYGMSDEGKYQKQIKIDLSNGRIEN